MLHKGVDVPVTIQIRNVPDDVYKKLKARAAAARISVNEYLLRHDTRKREKPSIPDLIQNMRRMETIITKETSAETVRAMRGQ